MAQQQRYTSAERAPLPWQTGPDGLVCRLGSSLAPRKVRISGPQITADKRDGGDRPTMWVFCGDGIEVLVHEVIFSGSTAMRASFPHGDPQTGAVVWLETHDPITLTLRHDRRVEPQTDPLVAIRYQQQQQSAELQSIEAAYGPPFSAVGSLVYDSQTDTLAQARQNMGQVI